MRGRRRGLEEEDGGSGHGPQQWRAGSVCGAALTHLRRGEQAPCVRLAANGKETLC